MKKLMSAPLILVTLLFCVFILGLFLGRNSYVSPVQSSARNTSETASADPAEANTINLMDLNAATAEQLEAIPGIGPVTAQRIVEYRVANGPFPSLSHLIHVEGIGEKTLTQILDYLFVQEDTQ